MGTLLNFTRTKEDRRLHEYYLLLASLGPVQDFIRSARTCQDLWFGSWMLSDLARATAQAFQESVPTQDPLIFPGEVTFSRSEESPSVANKILAIFSSKKSPEPKEVASRGREAMQQRLKYLGEIAYAEIRRPNYFHRDVAVAQLNEMMEYQWVSSPLESLEDYADARDQAERLLAQRKNTRNWGPVPWTHLAGVGVPKSSLDGFRESAINEELYAAIQRFEKSNQLAQAARLRSAFYLKGMERLCGVGLLKRIGSQPPQYIATSQDEQEEPVLSHQQIEEQESNALLPTNPIFQRLDLPSPTFHSTSHAAASPLLTRLALGKHRRADAIHSYIEALSDQGMRLRRMRIGVGAATHAQISDLLEPESFSQSARTVDVPRTFQQNGRRGYDGTFVFESRVEEILEESGVYAEESAIRELRKRCVQMLQEIGMSEPTPYYAFLLADGDRMGNALDVLSQTARENKRDAVEAHRAMSRALVAFNEASREIVTKAGGSLIYAGGDDVLAIVPLHTALQCAWQLQGAFREKTSPCVAHVQKKDFQAPTLSVGIGVAHHMEPMSEARDLAERAERIAKQNDRNSLGIVVSKRSGSELEAVGKWDEAEPLYQRIAKWARLLSTGVLPHGAAYKIEEAVRIWELSGPDTTHTSGDVLNTITSLALRVINRSRSQQGSVALETEAREALHRYLQPSEHPVNTRKEVLERIRKLSEEIQIARLFLRARNDAFEIHPDQPSKEVV